jgi:protein phosphatase
VGDGLASYQPGDTLVNRYLCKSPRIFLDTKPGLYPTVPTEIPQEFISYLRLSPYRLHVPQIYDIVPSPVAPTAKIALLDETAFTLPGFFYSDGASPDAAQTVEPQLLPALMDVWEGASALRQLNWLWQMAQLWHPFTMERAVSSLLSPELIRTEGSLIRMLELRSDGTDVIALPQLGQLWSQWVATAKSDIAQSFSALCQELIQGQIRNSEQLIDQLDQLLSIVGRSQARQLQIATRTDQGPSRQRNEDSCFPPSGTVTTKTVRANQTVLPADNTLVVVCDGIGGHQGGDVASNLAIEAIRQQVQTIDIENIDPNSLTVALEQAVCVANDQISQRNDNEQRYDRQRMGTTLVMGVVRSHELYITHVGDSRAYWITRQGCHQVTLDDDVASREVRLGYSPYREALQQPSAGSLVQALGMGSSSILHPTVQRFLLDEDSVFLLCSDGLSDNDRVEEYWEATLLPLLEGKLDVATVAQQLVDIANTRNGHDNVTVGLLYVRVADSRPATALGAKLAEADEPPIPTRLQHNQNTEIQTSLQSDPGVIDTAKTKVVSVRQRKSSGTLRLFGLIVLLLGGGGLLVYSLSLSFRNWVDSLFGLTPPVGPDPAPTLVVPSSSTSPPPDVQPGSFIQINTATTLPLAVQSSPPADVSPQTAPASPGVESVLTPGSILKVLTKRATSSQERWVQVEVCSVPNTVGLAPAPSPSNSFQPVSNQTVPLSPPSASASPSPSSPSLSSPSPLSSPTAPVQSPASVLAPGSTAWVREALILPLALPKDGLTLTATERGVCNDSPIPSNSVAPSAAPGESPVNPATPAPTTPKPALPGAAEPGVS